jgi:hypothetical protein
MTQGKKIMKGKRVASLETFLDALRNKIGWQVSDSNHELTLPTCSVPELRLNGLTRPEVIKPWLHAPEVAVAPTRIRPFGMRR